MGVDRPWLCCSRNLLREITLSTELGRSQHRWSTPTRKQAASARRPITGMCLARLCERERDATRPTVRTVFRSAQVAPSITSSHARSSEGARAVRLGADPLPTVSPRPLLTRPRTGATLLHDRAHHTGSHATPQRKRYRPLHAGLCAPCGSPISSARACLAINAPLAMPAPGSVSSPTLIALVVPTGSPS